MFNGSDQSLLEYFGSAVKAGSTNKWTRQFATALIKTCWNALCFEMQFENITQNLIFWNETTQTAKVHYTNLDNQIEKMAVKIFGANNSNEQVAMG